MSKVEEGAPFSPLVEMNPLYAITAANELRQQKELEALCSAGAALSANLRLPDILDHILENLASVMEFDHAAVMLLEGEKLRVISLITHPHSTRHWDKGSVFPLQSVLKDVMQLRTILILDESQKDKLFMPDLLKDCRSWIGVPLLSREYSIGILSIESWQVDAFQSVSLLLLEAFAGQISISIERERLAEQAQFRVEMLSQRVSEKTRDLWHLFQVTAIANAYTDKALLIEEALEQIQKAVQAEASFLFLYRQDKDTHQPQIELTAEHGLSKGMLEKLVAVQADFYQYLCQSKTPVQFEEHEMKQKFPFLHPMYYQLVLVALRSSKRVLGLLGLLTRSGRVLTINSLSLAGVMAENVSIALEREDLRQQAAQAAVMEERQRIARDLHDSVSQSLSSACMIASATRQYLEKKNWEALYQSVTDIQRAAYQALREMRLLLYELKPLSIPPLSVIQAFQKRLDLVERRAGLEVEVQLKHFDRLPIEVQQTMFSIAQEALNNVLKHAYASKVWVSLLQMDGSQNDEVTLSAMPKPKRWVLEIRDDGEGFVLGKIRSGYGLVNMRERAQGMGLSLEIKSQKNKGTSVRVIYEEHEPSC